MSIDLSIFWIILFFTILNEAIIEYLCGNIENIHPYTPLLSLAMAILLTFVYQLSIFALLGIKTGSVFFEFLFSAFVVARLSNFINDLVQKLLGSK